MRIDNDMQPTKQPNLRRALRTHGWLLPPRDMIAPIVRRRFVPDQVGVATLVVPGDQIGNVLRCRRAQGIHVGCLALEIGQRGEGNAALTTQIQYILVAKLAIEIRDARNRLYQLTFGGAAGMNHRKERPHQPSVAIGRLRCHIFRSSHAKFNPAIAPAVTPETGASHQWPIRLAPILHQGKVPRPGKRKALTHKDARFVSRAAIDRLVLTKAKDRSHQLPNPFLIGGRGPATDQAIAQVAKIGWVS